ncbi:hypothetical protein R2A130_3131 [Ahrensia sp. R2A130]|nr:hypothetical protein R2A130_3131 [Ahrensia sp. R2A130]
MFVSGLGFLLWLDGFAVSATLCGDLQLYWPFLRSQMIECPAIG